MKLVELFPEAEDIHEVQDLWHELLAETCCLSVRPEQLQPTYAADFERKAREFVNKFRHIPFKACNTLYAYHDEPHDPIYGTIWLYPTLHTAGDGKI